MAIKSDPLPPVLRLRLTVGAIDRDCGLTALDNALHGQQIRTTPRLVPDPMLDEAMERIEENAAKAHAVIVAKERRIGNRPRPPGAEPLLAVTRSEGFTAT